MDFSYTESELAFRDDLRHWLESALPAGWGESVFEPDDEQARAMFRLEWERKLYKSGWNGINWPKKYGGRGATLVEQAIFAEEMANARAPDGMNIIGRLMGLYGIAVTSSDARVQELHMAGAHQVIVASSFHVHDQVREATHGEGAAAVIEVAGSPTFNEGNRGKSRFSAAVTQSRSNCSLSPTSSSAANSPPSSPLRCPSDAAVAHQRLESRTGAGRIVLTHE